MTDRTAVIATMAATLYAVPGVCDKKEAVDAALALYQEAERQVRAAYSPTSKPLVTHDLSEENCPSRVGGYHADIGFGRCKYGCNLGVEDDAA